MEEPVTRYDPLQTFIENDRIIGFRVNLVLGRRKRPREQQFEIQDSYLNDPISKTEIENSPLYKVIAGKEPGVYIAGDKEIIGDPTDDEQTTNLMKYNGVSIMNKFSPLGLYSKQARGVAMVNYPTTYIRSLSNPVLNYHLLLPMAISLKFVLESSSLSSDLRSPVAFFNIGASSGSSLKYLHSQSYAIPQSQGLNSYAFQRAFNSNKECLTCKIANNNEIEDHLGQVINYGDLTIWEDDYSKVVVPYAPFRTSGTRIFPKRHFNYFGNMDKASLMSLGRAMTIADYVMNSWSEKAKLQPDRTIPFRQAMAVKDDFHLFIDMLPPFPILAAESADYLGMAQYPPELTAQRMRELNIDSLFQD